MTYDPSIPLTFYEKLADEEWSRLTKDRNGELVYHVHLDLLKHYIASKHHVLELGAGAGIYSKELVHMAKRVVVSDLSPVQLELNRQHMQELGLFNRIDDFLLLDLIDLNPLESDSFDIVLCVGGPLNYLLDKEKVAIREMLRVIKPGGLLIVGVMSLLNTVVRFMGGIKEEKDKFGIDAMRWVMETGIQDGKHYPAANQHYVHMMTSGDMDKLLSDEPVEILEKRAAGLLGVAGEDELNTTRNDEELWALMLDLELAYSKLPGALDCGSNIIYVVRKQ